MNKIDVIDTFRSSWQKMPGTKGPIWFITLVAMIPVLLVQIALINIGLAFYHETPPIIWTDLVMPIITNFILGIFMAGVIMPAIRQLRGERINIKTGFYYFRRAPQMMTLMLITSTLTSLLVYGSTILNSNHGLAPMDFSIWRGSAFLISAAIYFFCYISVALIADAKLTAFSAIIESVKKVAPQIHKVILILVIYFLLFLIVISPLVLGSVLHGLGKTTASSLVVLAGLPIFAFCMVWLFPLSVLLQANVYLKLTQRK